MAALRAYFLSRASRDRAAAPALSWLLPPSWPPYPERFAPSAASAFVVRLAKRCTATAPCAPRYKELRGRGCALLQASRKRVKNSERSLPTQPRLPVSDLSQLNAPKTNTSGAPRRGAPGQHSWPPNWACSCACACAWAQLRKTVRPLLLWLTASHILQILIIIEAVFVTVRRSRGEPHCCPARLQVKT